VGDDVVHFAGDVSALGDGGVLAGELMHRSHLRRERFLFAQQASGEQ